MQQLIEEITKDQLRTDHPDFSPGDTVRVHAKVVEGSRERIQVFEGIVIKRQNGGISETFTVRKHSYGVGVERTFPVHSRSEEHTSELQSRFDLVCRLLLENITSPPQRFTPSLHDALPIFLILAQVIQ